MPLRLTISSTLLAFLLPLSSCSLISTNARQNQAVNTSRQSNELLIGTGNVAMSTLRATTVAALHRPINAAKLGLVLAWQRPTELLRSNLPSGMLLGPDIPEIPGTPEFESLLDTKGFLPAAPGNLALLIDGERFFPEFERLVKNADRSVDVQVYIFDNDDIGVRYANLLKQRSRDLQVRVLFDDIGTAMGGAVSPDTPAPPGFSPPDDMLSYLAENSNILVRRILNPWLVSDHTKLIVIDRKTALLGGMNIGREYFSEWHDLMARIEGPVVGRLQREFERNWRKAGPWGGFSDLNPLARAKIPKGPGIPIRVLKTDPAMFRYDILRATRMAIRAARSRVWIETPYFSSDEIAREAEAAARRGVDVRIVIPSRGDSNIMDLGNLATARTLILSGAKVFRYPGMTHAKVTLCDGWATLGSANLDILSLRINRELNVAISDPATIQRIESQFFTPDFQKSRPLTLEETKIPAAPLAESIADQL